MFTSRTENKFLLFGEWICTLTVTGFIWPIWWGTDHCTCICVLFLCFCFCVFAYFVFCVPSKKMLLLKLKYCYILLWTIRLFWLEPIYVWTKQYPPMSFECPHSLPVLSIKPEQYMSPASLVLKTSKTLSTKTESNPRHAQAPKSSTFSYIYRQSSVKITNF